MSKDTLKSYIANLNPSLIGRFIYYCLPYRKGVVLKNMRLVFKDKLNDQEIKKLAKSFYGHFVRSFKENVVMRFLSEKEITDKVKVLGEAHLSEALRHNKGVLILTGHLGNWEFAPIGGILQFKALRGCFHFIRRTFKVKFIEKLLFSRYLNAGLNVIPKSNAVNQACDALEKNHLVIFVMDQHAQVTREGGCKKDGVEALFFGKKAGTYRSLATIARYSGARVVPATSFRQQDGSHVLAFLPPIPWEPHEKSQDAIFYNTQNYNKALEQFIMAHPEQWIWMHKRWKI